MTGLNAEIENSVPDDGAVTTAPVHSATRSDKKDNISPVNIDDITSAQSKEPLPGWVPFRARWGKAGGKGGMNADQEGEALENVGSNDELLSQDGDGGEGGRTGEVVWKVYKRRWFGLGQLVLLNIVVSWDVSILLHSRLICIISITDIVVGCVSARLYLGIGQS